MKIPLAVATVILSCGLAATLPAATPFFAQTYEGNSQLFLVDPDTGASSLVGATGVNGMTDLAITSAGQLFGANLTSFYSIDTGTGSATLIGNFGTTTSMVGLDVASDGRFYGVEAGGGLFRVDAGTGAATLLFGTPFFYGGDVTHFSGDIFYAAAFVGGGTNLIEINAGTSTAVDLGQIALDVIPGLDFDINGRLVACAASGKFYEIPNFASSGAGVLLSVSAVGTAGVTTVPVPEPSVAALFLIGALGATSRVGARKTADPANR
jgi:hypothetical protein